MSSPQLNPGRLAAAALVVVVVVLVVVVVAFRTTVVVVVVVGAAFRKPGLGAAARGVNTVDEVLVLFDFVVRVLERMTVEVEVEDELLVREVVDTVTDELDFGRVVVEDLAVLVVILVLPFVLVVLVEVV